jgi:membrane fusion protein, copper/silver efflux system
MTNASRMQKTLIAVTVLAAGAVGAWIGRNSSGSALHQTTSASARKPLFYQDSMHPWVKAGQPGKCTVCGMDLTPIYEGQSGHGLSHNFVALSSNNITVLDVQTEEVKRQEVARVLQVAGTLEADETKKTVVAAPAAGRVDDLTVRFPGVEVREGERLVSFYSPELTLEKRRFLVRARMSVQKDPTGGLAMQTSDTDPYYSDLIAPQSGTIVERKVYKGQYVTDGEKMFTIVDLSVLWFRFDVYEQQLPWLALGQTIDITVPAVPGRTFPAVISFIEPMLNESTRTVKVRAEFKNPLVEVNGHKQRLLGLSMYAQGEVRARLQPALAVARTAILLPGGRAYAYVDKGNGVYEKRCVKLGHQGDGLWEVVQGLEPGERVVTSGNVLIDAQAQFTHSNETTELVGEETPASATPAGLAQAPDLRSSPAARAGPHPKLDSMADATIAEGANPAAELRRSIYPVSARPASPSSATKPAVNPRHPVQPRVSAANPGFRNTRLGAYDAAFDAAFNRMAELRTSELTERAAASAAQPPALTPPQAQDLQAIVVAADGIAGALAGDDLEKSRHDLTALTEALAPAAKDFPETHSLSQLIQRLNKAATPDRAKDLVEARAQFLPLGAAVAELARNLKNQGQAFAGLKVYHCPMAPKPGLWMQANGPLRNPFFGAKMLNCGEEVSLPAVPGDTSLARNNHDQPAN